MNYSFYISCNERGEVILTDQDEAEAVVTISVVKGQIMHGSVELLDSTEEEEMEEEDEEEGQMDLFDIFSKPKFGNREGYDD